MICKSCNTKFLPQRGNQLYCSPKCQRREQKRRCYGRPLGFFEKYSVCVTCGLSFEKRERTQKYCSLACYKGSDEYRKIKADSTKKYRADHPEYVKKDKLRLKENRWKYQKPGSLCPKCNEPMKKRFVKKICHTCEQKAKEQKRVERRNYVAKHPAVKLIVQRFFSRKKGLPTNFARRDWVNVLDHFNNKCAYCGCDDKLHQDHFVPSSRGGGYTRNNIVPACQSCNSRKSNHDPQAFLSPEKYHQIASYLQSV
jgi:5-methylcytosine-specific restriction endonuclease McrA